MRLNGRKGLSFVEIAVALTILSIAATSIIMIIRGVGRETVFSSEHYTAMFIGQKVIEDISARLAENPHYFGVLIARGEGYPEKVVDGESEFFRLLENTQNFNILHEDDDQAITAGDLYEQVKGFTVQVSSRFTPDPLTGASRDNLVQVNVVVRWLAGGTRPVEYRISQFFHGFPTSGFAVSADLSLSPQKQALLDEGARSAAAGMIGMAGADTPTLDDIATANPNSSRECMIYLGRLEYLSVKCLEVDSQIAARIIALENSRDALANSIDTQSRLDFVDLQRKISETYEQKAVTLVGYLLLMHEPLDRLYSLLRANPPTPGRNAFPLGERLRAYRVTGMLGRITLINNLVPLAFSSAEKTTMSLLAPPYFELIAPRDEPAFFRKVLDLQKLGILRQSSRREAREPLRTLQNNISMFRKRYHGRFPNFSDYLKAESEISSNIESLKAFYRGATGVFESLAEIPKRVERIRRQVKKRM